MKDKIDNLTYQQIKNNVYAIDLQDLIKRMEKFNSQSVGIPLPLVAKTFIDPIVIDDTYKQNLLKLTDVCPMLEFGSLIDEILESKSFGGIQEIMETHWNSETRTGVVVALMKDWRVFYYSFKANELSVLTQDKRISEINRSCMIHEDMDDYCHWLELGGHLEQEEKEKLKEKVENDNVTVYGEKMKDALSDFFNGNLDAISNIMSKNSGQSSYTESKA